MREARIEAAERSGVVVDLRDAELARLELLNEALDPLFEDIPPSVELFDRGISQGDMPRLWIDVIAHVEMGRDKRQYRFVQDTRYGRAVLAEIPRSSRAWSRRSPATWRAGWSSASARWPTMSRPGRRSRDKIAQLERSRRRWRARLTLCLRADRRRRARCSRWRCSAGRISLATISLHAVCCSTDRAGRRASMPREIISQRQAPGAPSMRIEIIGRLRVCSAGRGRCRRHADRRHAGAVRAVSQLSMCRWSWPCSTSSAPCAASTRRKSAASVSRL